MINIFTLKEACASVAIETGEDPNYYFYLAVLDMCGFTGKSAEKMARKQAEEAKARKEIKS